MRRGCGARITNDNRRRNSSSARQDRSVTCTRLNTDRTSGHSQRSVQLRQCKSYCCNGNGSRYCKITARSSQSRSQFGLFGGLRLAEFQSENQKMYTSKQVIEEMKQGVVECRQDFVSGAYRCFRYLTKYRRICEHWNEQAKPAGWKGTATR